MTTELKQAAQQAVDAFEAFGDADDFASLFELTQKIRALRTAIQQAESDHARLPGVLKDHQIAAMVNSLRDIARQFHGHDSLRERIANVLVPALKAEAKTGEPIYQICKADSVSIHSAWVDVDKQAYDDAGLYPEYGRRMLYTHPAPGVPEDVVRDAERYRWLAAYCRSTPEHWGGRWSIVIEGPAPKTQDSEGDFDAAIDAAMLAAQA